MTLQQKRRAMAEACPGILFVSKGTNDVCWKDTGVMVTEREWLYAVHLAEQTLTGSECLRYAEELNKATNCFKHITPVIMICATESQRIDAWLKVKGLWRE